MPPTQSCGSVPQVIFLSVTCQPPISLPAEPYFHRSGQFRAVPRYYEPFTRARHPSIIGELPYVCIPLRLPAAYDSIAAALLLVKNQLTSCFRVALSFARLSSES